MADKSKSPTSKSAAYISSSGQTLNSLPISARLNNFANDLYNFFGLYFVSLLSLDPYAAAQSSRFNTRGPGRNTNTGGSGSGNAQPRPGGTSGLFGGGRLGGGATGGNGSRGGSGGGSTGRRMGTVDEVRGPECGSCG